MSKRNTKKSDHTESLFKSGALIRGDDEALEIKRLPTGIPSLDEIMGGGWPLGDYTMIVGGESTGKTILTQYAARSSQEHQRDRPIVLYVDTEHSYDREWWKKSSVDAKSVWVLRASTGEELIDAIVATVEETPELGMVIIDSLAGMPPSIIVEETAGRADVGSHARLMVKLFNRLNGLIFQREIPVIMTNQVRTNIGGPGETYPGGRSVAFYSHIILRTKRTGWITEGSERIGFNMDIECRKNKTAPPQRSIELPFTFTSQIDLVSAIINESIERGYIIAKTPYYEINGHKALGKANLRAYIESQNGLVEELRSQLYG